MGGIMSSAKQFREFALECMHRADEARDERQRQALRGLAEQWMRAAVQMPPSSISRIEPRYTFGAWRNAVRSKSP
jgi:hypothetical protein